jgi:hypothetical protein
MTSPNLRLKHDVTANLWGSVVTIPAGTRCELVRGASGTKGDLFAIADVAKLIELTGNAHDPHYRYAFVDNADVEAA